MLKETVKAAAESLHGDVVETRRYLHAHPELSFAEYETSAYVKQRLDSLGIAWKGIAGTGIEAIITGGKSGGNTIALRADMDALPITEQNMVAYASRNPGVMHACGHDAHTASLMGTAAILQSMRQQFAGIIKLIFQPGEEKLPGGASLMINAGVLREQPPAAVFGQHVMPSLAAGKVAFRKGRFLASMDELSIEVHGRGGHGAMPHQNIDPVLVTAHIIIALQQVVSRYSNPTIPSVLSFGKVVADGAINIIPDKVYVQGTFRTIDEAWRAEAHARMKKMATGIAESMGATCTFDIVVGYPALVNDEGSTHRASLYAGEYLGAENVVEAEMMMIAEDFAYYTRALPSCFYLLGVGNTDKKITASLHTPTFNIDEEALALSTGLMAYIALRELGN